MNDNLIIKFEYDAKQFNIYLKENKAIYWRIVENENIREPNLYEKDIFGYVLKSLLVNPSGSRFFRREKVFESIVDIYFDYDKRIYFWDINVDSKISSFLNLKYNNAIECLNNLDEENGNSIKQYYFNNVQKESENYFKRIIPSSTKDSLIKVFISASLSLAFFLNFFNYGNTGYKYIEVIDGNGNPQIVRYVDDNNENSGILKTLFEGDSSEDESIEYNYQLIENIIKDNPNIGTSEKTFILNNFRFVFDEYHQYMDLGLILYRLQNLKIEYHEEQNINNNPDGQLRSVIAGEYRVFDDKIVIYGASSFDNADKPALLHEFFHVLQLGAINDNSKLFELSNQVFTEEAMWRGNIVKNGSQTFGYRNTKYIYYALAKLVPKDVLKKFQFDCNIQDFADSVCSNEEEYEKFYLLCDHLNNVVCFSDLNEEEYNDGTKAINEILDYFYLKYRGYSFYDDPCFVLEKGNTLFQHSFYNYDDLENYILSRKFGINISNYRNYIYLDIKLVHGTCFSDFNKKDTIEVEIYPLYKLRDDMEIEDENLAKVLYKADMLKGFHIYDVDDMFQDDFEKYMENSYESFDTFRQNK